MTEGFKVLCRLIEKQAVSYEDAYSLLKDYFDKEDGKTGECVCCRRIYPDTTNPFDVPYSYPYPTSPYGPIITCTSTGTDTVSVSKM